MDINLLDPETIEAIEKAANETWGKFHKESIDLAQPFFDMRSAAIKINLMLKAGVIKDEA